MVERRTNTGEPSLQKLIDGRQVKDPPFLEAIAQKGGLRKSQHNGLQIMSKKKLLANNECPLCKWEIRLTHNVRPGDLILCKGCSAEYELYSVHPIRIRPSNFYNGFDEYSVSL